MIELNKEMNSVETTIRRKNRIYDFTVASLTPVLSLQEKKMTRIPNDMVGIRNILIRPQKMDRGFSEYFKLFA